MFRSQQFFKGLFFSAVLVNSSFAFAAPKIPELICSDTQLQTLCSLVKRAGLQGTLQLPESDVNTSSPGWTLFAPTDEAFAALPIEVRNALLSSPERLKTTLLSHVLETAYDAQRVSEVANFAPRGFVEVGRITTASSYRIRVEFRGDALYIEDSRVVVAKFLQQMV